MGKEQDILYMMHRCLRDVFSKSCLDFDKLQEIRLRTGKPMTVKYKANDWFVSKDGSLTDNPFMGLVLTEEMINETLEYMLRYSRYAFEEEIRQGYITVNGGHRVGIGGKVITEKGDVKNIKKISALNIRLSHEVKGCASSIMSYIYDMERVRNVLIVSPPCCGKTTLLRDIVRQVSDGSSIHKGENVTVIDERSEIAACFQGVAQNDVGLRTDVLDDCPKAAGMMMAVRSLSPSVIAVDEIGGVNDARALQYVINSGCSVFATAHGYSLEDINNKPVLSGLISDGSFERIIILKKDKTPGCIAAITDQYGNKVFERRNVCLK